MKKDNAVLKFVFGLVIFGFSLALAYFTASYIDKHNIWHYWPTITAFAGAYVLLGIVVVFVFPISLGFLFSADVLVLHVLFEKYGGVSDLYKAILVGVILIILYIFIWKMARDRQPAVNAMPPPQPPPTV